MNNQGEAEFGRWQPMPVHESQPSTYRMRMPGGWLVRVFDTITHTVYTPGPHGALSYKKTTIAGNSHVVFVPDAPVTP